MGAMLPETDEAGGDQSGWKLPGIRNMSGRLQSPARLLAPGTGCSVL